MNAALENLYYYQNPNTNQPSSSAVSARQLCRTLCPTISNSSGSTDTRNKINKGFINDSTPIIAFDPITGIFDESGWKAANMIPILRESCSSWHYEDANTNDNENETSTSTAKGPISCRQLASLYYDTSQISNDTRVWSPELASMQICNEWKKIIEFPHLLNAIEAFDGVVGGVAFQFNQGKDKQHEFSVSEHAKRNDVSEKEHDEGTQQQNDENALLQDFFTSTSTTELCEEDEEYESDGGTTYIKVQKTRAWVDSRLVKKRKAEFEPIPTPELKNDNSSRNMKQGIDMKKKKKPKFKAKNAKCWVYATGFPADTNEQEVAKFFQKAGILDIDPETQRPKVKLYRHREGGTEIKLGTLKGDASVCYARPESVNLASQLLDDAVFRSVDSSGKFIKDGSRISVQRAKFEQHGEKFQEKRKVSDVKRKVARVAKLQAVGWDDGANGRITGGIKGLRIVVLKHVFDALELKLVGEAKEDALLKGVESEIREECQQFGDVEKITIFSKNIAGVVIVKFTQPLAASKAIEEYNGRIAKGRAIEALYWDGVTDYTVRDERKEANDSEKRLDDFGNWLDEQELPKEFQLQVEGA